MRRSGTGLFLMMGLSLAAIRCGSSEKSSDSDGPESGRGGSSGTHTSGGTGTATGGKATGGSSGTAAGGAAGAMGGSGGKSVGGSSGSAAGGTASGSSGSATGGAGGTAGGDWDDVCGPIGFNGLCDGNIYVYCDYFTRSVKLIDCSAHDMHCVANPTQWYEDELNGCVGAPCSGNGAACDGSLLTECLRGELHLRDCTKRRGAGSTCMLDGDTPSCTQTPCDTPNREHCDGSMAVTCDEDSHFSIIDCKRCDPAGECIADPNNTDVGGQYCSLPTMGCTPEP